MADTKNDTDSNKLLLVGIIAIVAIVAIFLGFFGMNKSDKESTVNTVSDAREADLVGEASRPRPQPVPTCEDTDGWNYDLKGITTLKYYGKDNKLKVINKEDQCIIDQSGTYLREFYCASSSRIGSSLINCYYGCSDGACIFPDFKYSSATVGCYDGYETTINRECTPDEDWYNIANNACNGHCVTYSSGWTLCLAWYYFGNLCDSITPIGGGGSSS